MSYRCDNCKRSFSGTPRQSFTGRKLCNQCSAGILGAGAGYSSTGSLGGTIATSGAARWISRALKRDKPTGI